MDSKVRVGPLNGPARSMEQWEVEMNGWESGNSGEKNVMVCFGGRFKEQDDFLVDI